jgi:hypothetical protein
MVQMQAMGLHFPGVLLVAVVLLLLLWVNIQLERLGMEIKAMVMVIMVEVMVLILVAMELLEGVLGMLQMAVPAMELVGESNRGVGATMVTVMGIQDMQMKPGGLILRKPLVVTVVLIQDRHRISN